MKKALAHGRHYGYKMMQVKMAWYFKLKIYRVIYKFYKLKYFKQCLQPMLFTDNVTFFVRS
jgi:hypothetical protein